MWMASQVMAGSRRPPRDVARSGPCPRGLSSTTRRPLRRFYEAIGLPHQTGAAWRIGHCGQRGPWHWRNRHPGGDRRIRAAATMASARRAWIRAKGMRDGVWSRRAQRWKLPCSSWRDGGWRVYHAMLGITSDAERAGPHRAPDPPARWAWVSFISSPPSAGAGMAHATARPRLFDRQTALGHRLLG